MEIEFEKAFTEYLKTYGLTPGKLKLLSELPTADEMKKDNLVVEKIGSKDNRFLGVIKKGVAIVAILLLPLGVWEAYNMISEILIPGSYKDNKEVAMDIRKGLASAYDKASKVLKTEPKVLKHNSYFISIPAWEGIGKTDFTVKHAQILESPILIDTVDKVQIVASGSVSAHVQVNSISISGYQQA